MATAAIQGATSLFSIRNKCPGFYRGSVETEKDLGGILLRLSNM